MNFLGVTSYTKLIENRDKKWIENSIIKFLIYIRQERKLSFKSASLYLDAVKKFYYVNSDFDFKWKLIKMYLGDDDDDNDDNDNNNSSIEDRPYTKQEIQTMLKTANDIRVKIIILLISSSGIRSGAISLIKLHNLTKIEKYNLYQITVYKNSKKSNYKAFCSPECTSMIDTYLQYRKHAGEELIPEHPLIREQFNPSDEFKVKNPKSIGSGLVKYLVNEVLTKYSSLKQKREYDYKNKRTIGRNSTMLTHGLRKYFDTESRKAGVYPDIVELLMGHKLQGVKKHYFKPGINDINELLEGTKECKGYVYAIDSLTINDENRLQLQNEELKKKEEIQEYIIDKRLKEKDRQIIELAKMANQSNTLLKQVIKKLGLECPDCSIKNKDGKIENDDEMFKLMIQDYEQKIK
jgi:integrase